MTHQLGWEEALDIALEAELKAHVFYAQAAIEVQDRRGRDLLGRLAAFEQYHYQQLSELVRSLQQDGRFIAYETRTLEQFAPWTGGGETSGMLLDKLHNEAAILSTAIDNEKLAQERYQVLARQTADPTGQAMFRDLAVEEQMHQRILEDEFYSLSNQGTWGWTGMYGE